MGTGSVLAPPRHRQDPEAPIEGAPVRNPGGAVDLRHGGQQGPRSLEQTGDRGVGGRGRLYPGPVSRLSHPAVPGDGLSACGQPGHSGRCLFQRGQPVQP